MSEETVHKPAARSPAQTRGFRIGAVIVVALAVGLIIWLVRRDNGGSSSPSTGNATAVSVGQIRTLAASVSHPIFWLGPKKGSTYELTRTPNGSIFIRYLPQGAEVGTKTPYPTVATYPFPGAFPALQAVAQQRGVTGLTLTHGGLAEVSKKDPKSVHVAYPGVDYQIEVYDPTPGAAMGLVAAGRLAAFGSLKSKAGGANATAMSRGGLKSLASSLGHPIYWAGPKNGYTYELTRTASGQVYLRYLPRGVKVGAKEPYLTVATYPFRGAFGAILALEKRKNAAKIALAGGGRAVVDPDKKSIHLAYPGSQYEVEVFDPSPRRARQVVESGQISTVG
jgi:hypothetical protein